MSRVSLSELERKDPTGETAGTATVAQVSSLKWLYSKQPKLGLTLVVDCAHALRVVHTTKRLVSLMLLKGHI